MPVMRKMAQKKRGLSENESGSGQRGMETGAWKFLLRKEGSWREN